MSNILYYIFCSILTLGVLIGISMMSKVKTAVAGNQLSAVGVTGTILLTMVYYNILNEIWLIVLLMIGLVAGILWSRRIQMIQMPQTVALLNGFGGAASALVAIISMTDGYSMNRFGFITGALALAVGTITLIGSLVAAGKLHNVLPQKSVVWKHHELITSVSLLLVGLMVVISGFDLIPLSLAILVTIAASAFFGYAFAIRVGGADMPITISLLNSFSGVAGSIAGMSINDPLLVAIGGIVGASGLLLTQIMCVAMNRHLMDILLGKTSVRPVAPTAKKPESGPEEKLNTPMVENANISNPLNDAKKVIIVPGYGMAIAQAQHLVKQLADKLTDRGAEVKYAIHPVAGRMPGHMNVLLAEADVPYDDLYEMDDINPQFEQCDVAIIIGANDVVNSSARDQVDTPIYGMPVLDADKAKHVVICNYDTKPGYAGVENPLYRKESGVTLMLGNASDTVKSLIDSLDQEVDGNEKKQKMAELNVLSNAKKVIIVPGYGMAIAQAQYLVKQLADKLTGKGIEVKFAIHPVAGRMPGHMNVLLAEADVPYDELYEMDTINPEFEQCDVAIIIGANDVVNASARDQVDTPIYGMPVLDVDRARHVIVCNYDTKPGYAGVDNPLYGKKEGVTLKLGNAADTLKSLIDSF